MSRIPEYCQKINEILSEYGTPPTLFEPNETAFEKLLNCLIEMDFQLHWYKEAFETKCESDKDDV